MVSYTTGAIGGDGGDGGGGDGGHVVSNDAAVGSAGTDYLGGGGGGGACDCSAGNVAGGNGGTGIVILRMLTANYSSTVSGNETPTTDGDYTVIKWHGDGSFTT